MKSNYSFLLKSVGNNIRNERKKKGISQEKLGFLAHLDRTYISSVERGERNISIINLYKISTALKVNVEFLIKCTSN